MRKIIQIALVVFSMYFLQVQVISACSIGTFTINDSNSTSKVCIGTDVTVRATGNRTAGCAAEGTSQVVDIIDSPAGANPTITVIDPDEISYAMNFDKAGSYTLRFTFRDAPSCSNSTPCIETKTIEVVDPRARFSESSVRVCNGAEFSLDVEFLGATDATVRRLDNQVTFSKGVSPVANNIGTVDYDIPVQGNFKLYIVRASSADIPNCQNSELLDSINVIMVDQPQAIPLGEGENGSPKCDLANENYQMAFKLVGGDGSYTLVTQGEAIIQGGDTLITNSRPDGEAFSIVVNSGETCGEFQVEGAYECPCLVNAGTMPGVSFSNCEDATITVNHDDTNLNSRGSDNLLFVLHTDPSPVDDINNILGWSPEPTFVVPGPEYLDSLMYISAVVGPYDPLADTLNLASSTCKDITPGTPVKWIRNDGFSIEGITDICANERNRMYEIKIDTLKNGSNPQWVLKDGSGAFVEAQNDERIFLSFPSNAVSTLYYETTFRINDDISCKTLDSVEIKIDASIAPAPAESKIILWPGDIFASTSDGPCYQWGRAPKFGDFAYEIFEGENDKYYFSPDKIGESLLEDFAYFVAVYEAPNCEFSFDNCSSIIFYNASLLPGLSIKDVDDFNAKIRPNPTDGFFRLELNGSYKGSYQVEVYNEIGQRIKGFSVEKRYTYYARDIDLRTENEGLYFITITNEFGKREIIKTVIAR